MIILGLNLFHADSSVCLIKDGKIVHSMEEERFKRIKHYSGFPFESLNQILKISGTRIEDIDYITTNKSSYYNILGKIRFNFSNLGYTFINNYLREKSNRKKSMISQLNKFGDLKNLKKIIDIPHHLSHISYSYFLSGFEDCFGLTVDGSGDFSTSESFKIKSGKIKMLDKILFPNSLGIFYQAFTQFLGFRRYGDEYKVMSLASYGKPKFTTKIREMIEIDGQFNFKLNLKYFNHHKIGFNLFNATGYPIFNDLFTREIEKKLGISTRYKNQELKDTHYDIAASMQSVFEETVFDKINFIKKKTNLNKACFSGGCFFNSKMAGKIKDNTDLEDIYIGSNPGDAGGAIGSALYLSNKLSKNFNSLKKDKISYAFNYDELSTNEIFKKYDNLITVKIAENNDELVDKTSELLKSNKIIAWFQSGSEWGPRALGFRSILANPAMKEVVEEINLRLKKRENFRPFAPSICVDDYSQYFEDNYDCSFMNYVVKVKDNAKNKVPAIVHVDGTSRVQSVSVNDNKLFYDLIKSFKNKTGIYCLLNTSFNIDEPICESPDDAISTFLRSNLEYLIINKNILTKKKI
ncbi:carbamoyltransferase family protein [Candidatus Pelagibacter bacterium nBUS_25]|uniref:carbamoyltransferase family protein n=1 Tax=Candidatus Pelagibacter bacterium nBUS_25 TaxID=3374187 RepID=UPI003EBD4195